MQRVPTAVSIQNVSVRFNMASVKIDNVKEYVIKLLKRQILFQEFYALKDVSFEVACGESWGIVGRNGSGKSTLLKMICGILAPYSGVVNVTGSIAPLIELGAGFDDELSGRENVFLNGAILGYSHKFMEAHLQDIIIFSELQQFMEVPVKNYSSGMRARLGFSIATTVKPDILIVDEVLAVGDFAFQQKCEARMQELLSDGTTLLYVSHSADSIKKICSKALWLERGSIKMSGDSATVCGAYINSVGK